MGARSLSRAYGAGMEPAHSRLDWDATWTRAAWRFGAWTSNPQVQEHDREKETTDQMGITVMTRCPAAVFSSI
jgi:hypothetical protein